ncbi:unnamed protein product [Xylocopa violacea]|uniref:Uncharacterized protein n=1 Tax=Xylocopa violacea TaxID=135666 RepID=A0ABP1P0C0_XYLVO
MTNLGAVVSVRRSENTVQRSIGFDPSSDIDNVIERIENIRLTRDRAVGNGREQDDRSDEKENGKERDSDEADGEDLIERGPTKLPICASTRNQPYRTGIQKAWQSETNETRVIDKAVKKILRDEELREKLNPCFERLEEECSSQIVHDLQWNVSNKRGRRGRAVFLPPVKRFFQLFDDTEYENYSIDDLLKNVQDGLLQSAQCPTQYSPLGWPKTSEPCFEFSVDNVVGAASGLDSRDSNLGQNVGGPSASYRPGQVAFSHSSLSSSSSVSIPFDWEHGTETDASTESLIQELMSSLEEEGPNAFRNIENGGTAKTPRYPETTSSTAAQKDIVAGNNVCSLADLNLDMEKSTITSNDFQIPTTIPSFESSRCVRSADRSTPMPWSILNLPSKCSEKASEKLKEMMDPKEMERAMVAILKRSPEMLAKRDGDGYTTLMCLVSSPDELTRNMAYLVPLVERLTTEALTAKNNRGEDALYLAAINCAEFPFVTAYLAASMLDKGIDLDRLSYRGDTLIHSIAANGDTHRETLAELLALKTTRGNRLFDLSKPNEDGRTALHVAIRSHKPFTERISSLGMVSLLLEYGADPRAKERKTGNNALHLAISSSCDPVLVKLLLKHGGSELANASNENLDTPLRVAAAAVSSSGKSIESLERQTEVCRLLIEAGSDMNFQENVPTLLTTCTGTEKTVGETFYKTS